MARNSAKSIKLIANTDTCYQNINYICRLLYKFHQRNSLICRRAEYLYCILHLLHTISLFHYPIVTTVSRTKMTPALKLFPSETVAPILQTFRHKLWPFNPRYHNHSHFQADHSFSHFRDNEAGSLTQHALLPHFNQHRSISNVRHAVSSGVLPKEAGLSGPWFPSIQQTDNLRNLGGSRIGRPSWRGQGPNSSLPTSRGFLLSEVLSKIFKHIPSKRFLLEYKTSPSSSFRFQEPHVGYPVAPSLTLCSNQVSTRHCVCIHCQAHDTGKLLQIEQEFY